MKSNFVDICLVKYLLLEKKKIICNKVNLGIMEYTQQYT